MSEGELKVFTADLCSYSSIVLPDTPHALFVRGELADAVGAPDGARVEVIEGKIVVSPAPAFDHGGIVQDVTEAFALAKAEDPGYGWTCQQNARLDLVSLEGTSGFEPDLVVGETATIKAARQARLGCVVSDEFELVLEVTSPSSAEYDRPPVSRDQKSKWSAYAQAGIPYYLLIDRDPKVAQAVLYMIPDAATEAYLDKQVWAFGETITLLDPFGVKIPTDEWLPWP